jgi:hypothetical protein
MTAIVDNLRAGYSLPAQRTVKTGAKVMVTGDSLFNITGDILLFAIVSECYTANGVTASTLQYSVTNNSTAASQTISGASAPLTSAAVGVSVVAQLGALANAPTVTTNSGVGVFPWGAVRIPGNSSIKSIIAVGSTVGAWKHYIKYEPLEDGAAVTAAF